MSKILVDTCVWSVVLRRSAPDMSVCTILAELIRQGMIVLPGVVRQEILSGIKRADHFEEIKTALRAIDDIPLSVSDYEEAASCYNTCRNHGVQGSSTDMLLCALSLHRNYYIFTFDKDFEHYKKHLPIKLYHPPYDCEQRKELFHS